MMEEVRLKLSALWVALMLTYLLGDVLRIFSGDFIPGEIDGMQVTQGMYLGLAALMVIPVIMVFLSLTLPYRANRWANIGLVQFGVNNSMVIKAFYAGNTLESSMMQPWVYLRHSVLAIFFFGFNAIGLPTYPSMYDQFLIVVGLVFNVLTVWYAWKWSKQESVEATA